MPTWPSSVPFKPVLSSYQEQKQSQVLRSDMDIGPPKSRRRFTAAAVTVQLEWLWTVAQLSDFETFFETDLEGGSLPFDGVHPRTGAAAKLRFAEPYTPQYSGYEQTPWKVLAKLEVLP
jgi:hypothetical protein